MVVVTRSADGGRPSFTPKPFAIEPSPLCAVLCAFQMNPAGQTWSNTAEIIAAGILVSQVRFPFHPLSSAVHVNPGCCRSRLTPTGLSSLQDGGSSWSARGLVTSAVVGVADDSWGVRYRFCCLEVSHRAAGGEMHERRHPTGHERMGEHTCVPHLNNQSCFGPAF